MNRGTFQSSLVQQMVGGSPSWWNMNNLRLSPDQTSPLLPSTSPSSSSSSSSVLPQYPQPSHLFPTAPWHESQDLPAESWSQLLLGGFVGEEDRCSFTALQAKKMENWEDQVLYPSAGTHVVDVKQETSGSRYICGQGNEEIHAAKCSWSQILPASSPRSCVTTSFSNNLLDFSNSKAERRHQEPDHSSECNSTATGSALKKTRVQATSAPSTLKVRKEKLGDRITALHQIVSPFGKTDTASVLLEAIGYIRFLQSQIEALSSPYFGSGSSNTRRPAQGERSCIFPEDPGQLLNDASAKKRGAPDQDGNDEPKRDLRSRGLCLVPVSCTMQVGSDNVADYWAPTLGGGFR